ncbi:hypothetical protein [Limosilactobacillus allomucosae]|uniref:hypothetical protein n=1 Tax=Limosilactobacillus allomucosae TaxID=3142938 RepID=UPI00326543D8
MLSTGQSIVFALVIVGLFGFFVFLPIYIAYNDPHTKGIDNELIEKVDNEFTALAGENRKRLSFANVILGDRGIYFRPDNRRQYATVITYDKMTKYHIAYQPTTTNHSGVGGAVVGGALFGVVGAIAGGLATRRQLESIKELILVIYTNCDKISTLRIDFIDGERSRDIIKNRVAEYEQIRSYLDNHGVPYTQEVLPSLP